MCCKALISSGKFKGNLTLRINRRGGTDMLMLFPSLPDIGNETYKTFIGKEDQSPLFLGKLSDFWETLLLPPMKVFGILLEPSTLWKL
jgi:hypothetical protein